MPRVKLTKRVVESVAPATQSILLRDTEVKGFHCKITPKGRRVYSCYYRTTCGQERRPNIGLHGEITVEQARDIARDILAQVRRDIDPSLQRKHARIAPDVKTLGERYLAEYAALRHKASYLKQQKRMIETKINPTLGTHKVAAVTYADVAALHNKYRDIPFEANRVLAALRGMFKHAILWGLRPDRTNPCQYIQKFREWRRNRLLSDDETRRLHRVLQEAESDGSEHPDNLLAIRLLFATASRISEIISLEWSFLNWDLNEIRWPDTKTGCLIKPLSSEVRELLQGRVRRADERWVLRSKGDPTRPPRYEHVRQAFMRLAARAGVENVILHSIRHRCATEIANSPGIPIKVGMQLTGHKTVATFMGYVHTEKEAIFAAAERVAESRRHLTRSDPQPAHGHAPPKSTSQVPERAGARTVGMLVAAE